MNITKQEKIILDIEDIICEDVGLFSLFKYHNLEFKHVSLTNKVPWKTLIFETLSISFLHLLLKKTIEIEVVEFQKTYFFNLYKTQKRVFKIKCLKPETRTNDILSNTILKLIEKQSKNTGNRSDQLNHLILNLFDEYLGRTKKYLKPEKDFFLKNLNTYVDKFDWLSIEEGFHNFGPLFSYNISIEPIYIPRLKMQHGALYEGFKSVSTSNIAYKQFIIRLKEVLDYNYTIRTTFSGTSNRFDTREFPIPKI